MDKQRFSRTRRRSSLLKTLFAKKKAEAVHKGRGGTWNPGQVKGLQLERRGDHREEKEAEIHLQRLKALTNSAASAYKAQGLTDPISGCCKDWVANEKGGGVGRLARRWKNRYFIIMTAS